MTTTRRTRTTRMKTLRATRAFYFHFKSLFDKTIPQIYAIFCDRNAFPQQCSSNIRDIFCQKGFSPKVFLKCTGYFLSEMLFLKSVPQIYEIYFVRNAFPQKCSSNIRDIFCQKGFSPKVFLKYTRYFLSEMLFPKSVPQIYGIFCEVKHEMFYK